MNLEVIELYMSEIAKMITNRLNERHINKNQNKNTEDWLRHKAKMKNKRRNKKK